MLKQIGELLVDVHGQHDHQYLLRPSNQIEVLDQFGNLASLAAQYRAAFAELSTARKRIEELATSRTLRQQKLELYRFQADEIDAAELDPAEYAELTSRASVLQNLERLKKEAGATHTAIYEADGSILERLKMASAVLADLAGIDGNLKAIADVIRENTIQLED